MPSGHCPHTKFQLPRWCKNLGLTTPCPSTAHTVQLSLRYYPELCEENAVLGVTYLSMKSEFRLKEDDNTVHMTPFCIYENQMCSNHNIPLSCIKTKTRKWRQGKDGLYRNRVHWNRKQICPARINSPKITKPFQTISGECNAPETKLAQIFRKFEKRKRD